MPQSTFTEKTDNQHPSNRFPTFLRAARCLHRGWKKSWRYLLGIILILVIAYAALDVYSLVQFNYQLNLIRQKGEPVSVAEIIPPKVPDKDNAAILYHQAAAALKSNGTNVGDGNISMEMDAKSAALLLSKNAKAVALIREAAAKSQCQFDVDWQNLLVTRHLEWGMMRDLARFLSLQANREAQMGKDAAALDDVRRLYVMADQMSGDNFLIGALSQRAMFAIANRALAEVLSRCSLTRQQARDFQASLPVIDWNDILHRALLVERATGIEYLDKRTPGFFKPLLRLGKLDELRFWRKIIDSAENTPVPVPSDYGDHITAEIRQLPWYAILAKISLPAFTHTRSLVDWCEVARRQREIAFALTAYHSQYHQYPATLREAETFWKSTFPLDPYSGKSFMYKNTEDGKNFLLYSIGVNRRDDKGIKKQTQGKDDIIWAH